MIEVAIATMSSLTVLGIARAMDRSDKITRIRVASLCPTESNTRRRPAWFATISSWLPGERQPIEDQLRAAKVDLSSDTVMAARWAAASIGTFLGLATGPTAIIVAPALGVLGYRLPTAYLKSKIAANKRDVATALPDAIELLAVCTQAGLNVPLALARVARATSGVLGTELGRVVDEIELGATRREAMGGLADRYDLEEVKGFVSALDHAERFGSGIASTLDDLASDMRARRRRQTEESARRAPVKMLFPLVLLILPAFILLTIVPLLLGTFQTLGF